MSTDPTQTITKDFAGHRLRENTTGEIFLIERSAYLSIFTGTTGAAFITRHGVPGYQVPFEVISLHVPEDKKGWTLLPPLPGRDAVNPDNELGRRDAE